MWILHLLRLQIRSRDDYAAVEVSKSESGGLQITGFDIAKIKNYKPV